MKLCALKVTGVPAMGISGLPLGVPGQKGHLDVAPVEKRRVYYKGEGGGFPQVRAVVSCRVYYKGEGGGFPQVRVVVSYRVNPLRGGRQHPLQSLS
jgi:hypothetical protein